MRSGRQMMNRAFSALMKSAASTQGVALGWYEGRRWRPAID